jgi:hypothetical protein
LDGCDIRCRRPGAGPLTESLCAGFQVGAPIGKWSAGWQRVGIVTLSMLGHGLVIFRLSGTSRFRTAGAAIAVAPATGGVLSLEIFT